MLTWIFQLSLLFEISVVHSHSESLSAPRDVVAQHPGAKKVFLTKPDSDKVSTPVKCLLLVRLILLAFFMLWVLFSVLG